MAPCSLVVSDQPAFWHLDAARGPSTPSFDDLVSAGEHSRWHVEAERLRGLKIDHRFVLRWRLHRQAAGLLALEDAIDVTCGEPVLVHKIRRIRNQAAG